MAGRVLIVEDEGILAMNMQRALEQDGLVVTAIAVSGEKALGAMRDTGADIVLMDIKLKGDMDGIETAEKIIEIYGVPIIYMSAHDDEATLERASRTGPVAFITKPVAEENLCRVIRRVLDIQMPGKE